MLGYFKKSREDIVRAIKRCPVTEDGHYFCKTFRTMNEDPGEKSDKGYTFSRSYFRNKVCFTPVEIEIYLERDPSYFDIKKMQMKDNFLYDIIKHDLNKKLNRKIRHTQYTLGDLIDSAIFYFNYKY